jgi:hypothetical protein
MAGIGPGYKGGLLPKQYSEEEITEGLMAMIAWAGNASAASRYLKSQKQIELPAVTLNGWKTSHAIRYDELREKYSGQVEAALAHELRDSAMQATQLTQLAMRKATERLESGEEQDPSRAAANASRVAQASVDKLLSITGRPSKIVETRNVQEVLRSLAAKGVIAIPEAEEAAVELTEGNEGP